MDGPTKLHEIKSRLTGEVLFAIECGSLRLCVEAAVDRKTDLRDADLRDADLSGSDLRGSDLRGSNLSGSNLSGVPIIPNVHSAIYEAASQPAALDMSAWHNACGTTHCRAGWVVTLAGEAGLALEKQIGTPAAAAAIYLASDPNIGKFPDFYCDNETALADMRARAEAEAAQ